MIGSGELASCDTCGHTIYRYYYDDGTSRDFASWIIGDAQRGEMRPHRCDDVESFLPTQMADSRTVERWRRNAVQDAYGRLRVEGALLLDEIHALRERITIWRNWLDKTPRSERMAAIGVFRAQLCQADERVTHNLDTVATLAERAAALRYMLSGDEP